LLFVRRRFYYFEMLTFTFRQLVIAAVFCTMPAWIAARSASAENQVTRIVALGDSLTAGYGLPAVDAFPAQLERALKAKGFAVTVANAGVTGDTAAMGLARLHRSIPDNTDAVILELGANDMLTGYEPSLTRRSLEAILQYLKARHVQVLLCGVRTQPERGDDYKKAFATMFADLAIEYNLLFYPAFDDAFVDDARLKLSDELHPTAVGVEAVAERLLPKVEALIDRARRKDR
jgi:acyl-CoA thioesterase I